MRSLKKYLLAAAALLGSTVAAAHEAELDITTFNQLLAHQQERYDTQEAFYENLPACTLVEVPEGTFRELKGATIEFEWGRESGAFVPTSADCGYGTMKVVKLMRSPFDSKFVPIGTDIIVDGRHVMAIIGEEGTPKKHYLGRFNGEESIRLSGRFFSTDGNPPLPAGMPTRHGLFPTLTNFSASKTKSGCQSTPVYNTAHVDDHWAKLSCN